MTAPDAPDAAFAAPLLAWLAACPVVAGARVVGWRLEADATAGLRVGVRAGRLGGPYECPGLAIRLGGSLDLHWSDGALTRASLDRQALTDPGGAASAWRAAAAPERRRPPILGPARLPLVETADPAVAQAVAGDGAPLLALARRLAEDVRAGGARRVDATLRASAGRRLVVTSAGFWAAWEETACQLDVWADELAGASFGRRRLPSAEEAAWLAHDVAERGQLLAREEPLPPTPRGVLFMPPLVEQLLARLLLPNLSGRAIRDGRSALTVEDVERGRPLLCDDLDLVVDTTLPLELATAPCSPEGVPAGRAALVANGRLVSPLVDPATAAELGRPPTPSPRGRPVALLGGRAGQVSLDTALELLGDGLVVRDLPGLHTQSPRSWSYALTAPDAQVVRGGRLGGRCAARLRGHLLDHLRQPSSSLVRIPDEPSPGLLVLVGLPLEAA